MILVPVGTQQSEAFTIKSQITLFASGLQNDDRVEFDVVSITRSAPASGDACCPGQVSLPDFNSVNPLTTCSGAPVQLTVAKPWAVLDMPQQVPLRARVVADPDAVIQVEVYDTTSTGLMCV